MELSGPSSEIPTVYQKILDLEILSRVHFQPKILCFRGYIVKQEMELICQLKQEMELSGHSSQIATDQQMILGFLILSKVHFQPKILYFRGCILKQEMELLKQEMESSGPCREIATVQQIILGFGILSKVHFQPKLLCFRNLQIKTGNGITETGNGIIWTFHLDSH